MPRPLLGPLPGLLQAVDVLEVLQTEDLYLGEAGPLEEPPGLSESQMPFDEGFESSGADAFPMASTTRSARSFSIR